MNGAPGLPNAPGRPTGATTNTTFAQTIGNSQPATPLDLSEFPSLSGAPQTQYQNPGQAVWGNSNQRLVQHTPVQRPQQQPAPPQQNSAQQQAQQSQQPQEHAQQSREALYNGSQFTGNNDDYHRGGQGGIGQLGASSQPQPNSIEDFPPLGRNGTDDSQQDRRGSLMQNAAFGGFSNSNAFSIPHTSSSNRQPPASAADHDRSALPTPRAAPPSNVNSLLSSFQNQHLGSSNQTSQSQQTPRASQGFQTTGAAQTADNTPLDQMAPIDRW
ncbi:MAG: hypothetical protein Q9174_006345, partial [Haloplaca sp. 1 TL-2023]